MTNRFWTLTQVLTSLLLLANCTYTINDRLPDDSVQPQSSGHVSIMAYNAENMFDTSVDANRDDFTYLPLALKQQRPTQKADCLKMGKEDSFYFKECMELDWNETVLNEKMNRAADTIMSVNGGLGPDVLLIEEIENQTTIALLNKNHLTTAGYQTAVVLEGDDKRGIDNGVLSRYPLASQPVIHRIEFSPPPTPQDPNRPPWTPPQTR